jgi:hypothetical protein
MKFVEMLLKHSSREGRPSPIIDAAQLSPAGRPRGLDARPSPGPAGVFLA